MSNVVGTLFKPEIDLFQVCTELDNHYSMNDKDLAEFIIDLAQKHADLEVRTTSIYIFRLFFGHFEKNSSKFSKKKLKQIIQKHNNLPTKNCLFAQKSPEVDLFVKKLPNLSFKA